MPARSVGEALKRAETVLRRRPSTGLHADATAVARWDGGTRMVTSHPNGHAVVTDMPPELGGSGDKASPGWLVRAGVAACAATTIASHASRQGVTLDSLEVRADSRSDTRGYLGLKEGDGTLVDPGPQHMVLTVRVAASGVSAEQLCRLVEDCICLAPMSSAMQNPVPMALRVEVEDA
jgi:uncharacterized OsmC-like protein